MTDNTQPEALRLANVCSNLTRYSMEAHLIAAELRRQHARIAELEAQLEAIGAGGVSGPLMGCASIAANAGSEPVAWTGGEEWEQLAWHLCAEEHGEDACDEVIWEGGPIPEPWGDRWMKYESDAKRMIELVRRFYTHHSPPEGMVGGWMPIETAPVAGLILLVVEDSAGERRVFPAEASHENGVWVWQVTLGWLGWTRLHSGWTPILWRRIPTPPTTAAGSGKG